MPTSRPRVVTHRNSRPPTAHCSNTVAASRRITACEGRAAARPVGNPPGPLPGSSARRADGACAGPAPGTSTGAPPVRPSPVDQPPITPRSSADDREAVVGPVELVRAGGRGDEDVLQPQPEPPGHVDARLDRERVAGGQRGAVAGDDVGILVLLDPDAVAGPVDEAVAVT